MFFTGTLQEGISKALQESKLVVCFVTDNEEESKSWEDEYLKDDAIAPSLEKDAVLLRLEAGSQEAGYLAALVPLPKNPTLVVIKNGELKEYITAGTSRDEFVRRVGGAFQAQVQVTGQGQTGTTTQSAASTEIPSSSSSNTQAPGQVAPAQSSTASSVSGQQQQQQQSSLSTSRNPNGAREQADRKEREETEKRRREKGKMREETQAQEQGQQDPEKAKQTDAKKKAAQQLAERQRQAREERARVLKRIEDDKAERRARDEARRAERRAAASSSAAGGGNVEDITALSSSMRTATSTTRRQHDQCAIQVRLFDGSTIRTRLPAQATLATDVRKWIDEVRADGKEPYTFKVILTPLPNRTVDPATEEGRTLAELGLAPSSTLVLAPVDRYFSSSSSSSPAYPSINAGLTNPLTRLIAAVLAYVGGILGSVVGAFTGSGAARGRVANNEGGGQELSERQRQQKDRAQGQATGRDGGIASSSRINGFQNPDDRQRDHQFYNGNSLSFEPRKDEDEKDK